MGFNIIIMCFYSLCILSQSEQLFILLQRKLLAEFYHWDLSKNYE